MENDEWTPKKSHKKIAEIIFKLFDNPLHHQNLADFVVENGMKWSAFCNYSNSEDFINWFNDELERKTNSKEWQVWRKLFGLIEKGDYKGIELYFKLKGKLVNKEQVEHQGIKNIVINWEDDESLKT